MQKNREMMQALVLNGVGEEMKVQRVQKPSLCEGEALIRMEAAALNRRDWWIQKGKYAGLKFPIILGSDGVGVVTQVADEVQDGHWLGQRVMIHPALHWLENTSVQPESFRILGLPDDGTFAEYVRVPTAHLFVKPDYLSIEEAASIPLAGLTAFRAIFTKGGVKPGDRVLISGVGGGVATFAMQWATHAGAEVYVTSGDPHKLNKIQKLGHTKGGVNYKDNDWADQLKEMAGGFDVIIDGALGEGFAHFLDLANPGGRIVFYGGTSGNIPELNGRKIFWKQLQILGTTMGSAAEFAQMLAFAEQHQIRPIIDEIFPWKEGQKALNRMTDSDQLGKLVLRF